MLHFVTGLIHRLDISYNRFFMWHSPVTIPGAAIHARFCSSGTIKLSKLIIICSKQLCASQINIIFMFTHNQNTKASSISQCNIFHRIFYNKDSAVLMRNSLKYLILVLDQCVIFGADLFPCLSCYLDEVTVAVQFVHSFESRCA